MRILVVSDSHGDEHALMDVIASQPDASVVIHLGDGIREAEAAAARFPERTFYMVRGNCDFAAADVPPAREETIAGRRLFFTHGQYYGVKSDLYRVVCAARERCADILLFGHTHQPLCTYEDGLYILNPGSLGYDGRFATVDLLPAGVLPALQRRM